MHVFEIGDVVEVISEYLLNWHPLLFTRKKHYTILEIDLSSKSVFFINDMGTKLERIDFYCVKLVNSTKEKDIGTNIAPELEKQCVCESMALFRKGCQCGAISKKQWGLGTWGLGT